VGFFSLSDRPAQNVPGFFLPNSVRAIEVFADLCYNASGNAPRCGTMAAGTLCKKANEK
jgi:hypothetical protein